MKICFVSRGNLIHIDPYMNSMLDFGHEIILLALTPVNREINKNINVHNLFKYQTKNDNLVKKISFIIPYLKLRKIIQEEKPDIIHAHYLTSGGYSFFFIPHTAPFFLTIHGSDILTRTNYLWSFFNQKILKKVDFIQCVSKQIEEKVLQIIGFTEKTITQPIGILCNHNIIKTNRISSENIIRIVSSRAFKDIYNPKYILNNLLNLHKYTKRSFLVTFIGDGHLLEECKNFVLENKLSKVIKFKGAMNRDDVLKEIVKSDFYLSASSSDGTSISLLEAMDSGLIPIVSNIKSNRDWVSDDSAIYFDLDNNLGLYSEITNKIDLYSQNTSEIRLINKQNVILRGNLLENMRKIERIYKRLKINFHD